MELDHVCSELSYEITRLLKKCRAKKSRVYPQAVWEKIAQLIKRIGIAKTCKLVGLRKPHVASKLGYEDSPKPSAAVMEFSQPITWASPCSPGVVVQIDYDGLKVKVEVENPLAIKWGDFFEAVKRSGGAR